MESAAAPGQSYYRQGGQWLDFHDDASIPYPGTGNFCMKAMATATGLRVSPEDDFRSEGPQGGPFTPQSMTYTVQNRSADPVAYSMSASPSAAPGNRRGRSAAR